MPRRCVANLDNISTIAKDLIQERITSLGAEKIAALESAIHFALDLEA